MQRTIFCTELSSQQWFLLCLVCQNFVKLRLQSFSWRETFSYIDLQFTKTFLCCFLVCETIFEAFWLYNLGQNTVDKQRKLTNIEISMEFYTADVLQFCCTAVKICIFGGRLSTCPSISSTSRISLKFPNFLISKVLTRLATREVTCIFSFW